MSEKAKNFKRLAEKRLITVAHHIKLVGNLANRYNYEYTEQQAAAIVAELQGMVDALADKFGDIAPVAVEEPENDDDEPCIGVLVGKIK